MKPKVSILSFKGSPVVSILKLFYPVNHINNSLFKIHPNFVSTVCARAAADLLSYRFAGKNINTPKAKLYSIFNFMCLIFKRSIKFLIVSHKCIFE